MSPSQTFHDHVAELRKRILWVVLAIGISTAVGYVLRAHLINVLQNPLKEPLYYTSPAGSFNFIFKLATIVGFFITLPVIIYQLMRFIEPALPVKVTKGLMVKVIGSSFALASGGIAFGYFYMIPMSLHFFAGYSSSQIKPLISANEYLSYTINILITFAIAFQIPLVVLFINRIKPLKPGKLLHYQRHVIVGSFVFSIALPFTYDPISQFIVAIPIVGLYYLSIVLLLIANRGRFTNQESHKVLLNTSSLALNPIPQMLTQEAPLATQQKTAPKKAVALDGFFHRPIVINENRSPDNKLQATARHKAPAYKIRRPGLSIDGLSQFSSY